MNNAAVGIADLLRAQQALEIEGNALDVAARMMGLTIASTEKKPPVPRKRPKPGGETPAATSRAASSYIADEGDSKHIVWLDAVEARNAAAVVPNIEDPLPARPQGRQPAARTFAPLFHPKASTDLLLAAASTRASTDAIDVAAVVDVLSRCRLLTELPHESTLTLGMGVQVLIDVGDPMQPFLRDQFELIAQLQALTGSADIGFYADDPMNGTGSTQRQYDWQPYRMPEPGRSVIVLSDLGLGTPRRETAVRAWLGLARRLRQRDCMIVAFAPLNARQISARMRRLVDVVVWDRSTARARAADIHLRR